MKLLKVVMYLFYRYYSTGGSRRIPYFSALCAIAALIYIHIFQILIILNKVDILPMRKDDLRIEKYGKVLLVFLPIFLVIALLIKPKDLKQATYDEGKIKKGQVYLVAYIILSFILLFVLMFIFPSYPENVE